MDNTMIAAGAIGIFIITVIIIGNAPTRQSALSWQFPAAISALFFIFSLYTVWLEGLFGFWAEHTTSYWGNQVWIDLLIGVGIGFALITPQARQVGMRPYPWLLLICCTGCIGLLAMLARLNYLKLRQ